MLGSQSGEKLPFKKRQIMKQFKNRTEMAREEAEGAQVEPELADATQVKENGRISVELEAETLEVKEEDALVEVKVEDATVGAGEEDIIDEVKKRDVKTKLEGECMKTKVQQETVITGVKDKVISAEEKVEAINIDEGGDLDEENGFQKILSVKCIINCEPHFSSVVNGDKQGNEKQELGLEETDAGPKGRSERERKREATDQSADSKCSLQ